MATWVRLASTLHESPRYNKFLLQFHQGPGGQKPYGTNRFPMKKHVLILGSGRDQSHIQGLTHVHRIASGALLLKPGRPIRALLRADREWVLPGTKG